MVGDVAQMNGVERRLQKRGEDIDRLRDEKDQLVSASHNLISRRYSIHL